MAAAGTVAVMLPGAFYTLRETQAAAGRRSCAPPACRWRWPPTATPAPSPMTSLLLAMNMACTLFRLTPEEALAGATRVAARALGLDDCGTIAPGLRADLAVWDAGHPAELAYRIGFNPLHARIFGGVDMTDARRRSPSPSSRRSGAAAPAALDPRRAPGDRGGRRAGRRGGRRRARRSTASTPASASSRASTIPAGDTARLQRNLILSHCSGVGDADARAGRPADDGAEARLARPRRLGRALGARRRCSQAMLDARRDPGGAGAGLGRRLAATSRRSPTWRR